MSEPKETPIPQPSVKETPITWKLSDVNNNAANKPLALKNSRLKLFILFRLVAIFLLYFAAAMVLNLIITGLNQNYLLIYTIGFISIFAVATYQVHILFRKD